VIASRWIWGSDEGPNIDTTILATADVRGSLPTDTPVVDADERAERQARRRAHFAQRRR